MTARDADPLDILRRFAPGTPLRHAAELILQQASGALIVIGTGPDVDQVCSGGFRLDNVHFTPQRLAELAKMDGGIVIDAEARSIVRANVHFIPNPTLVTHETGTRFRTAEQLALQTGKPILGVSEEGRTLAVVYAGAERYELRSPTNIQADANQILTSLERLRRRLDEAEDRLTQNEVDNAATVRDVAMVIQRAALVWRLHADIDRIVVELGGEGKLVALQAADLLEGVAEMAHLVYEDHARRRPRGARHVFDRLDDIDTEDLVDTAGVAAALGLGSLDASSEARGIRALAGVPRLPEPVKEALVSHFRKLSRLLGATVSDLDDVSGVGTARAEQLRSYLDHLTEKGSGFDVDV